MDEDLNYDDLFEDIVGLETALVKATEPDLPTKLTGRPKVPDTLTDTLITQLKPTVRVQLARSLIDIAVNGAKQSDRLAAIKEIYDRVEGRARQRVEQKTADDDPILKALNEIYKDPKKHNSSPYLIEPIEGEVRELDD